MVKIMKKKLDFDKTTYVPTCKKVELEFYSSGKELNERYNELMGLLLTDNTIHSFFPQPVKNKKGYWVMEVERYTKEWIKKYGK